MWIIHSDDMRRLDKLTLSLPLDEDRPKQRRSGFLQKVPNKEELAVFCHAVCDFSRLPPISMRLPSMFLPVSI